MELKVKLKEKLKQYINSAADSFVSYEKMCSAITGKNRNMQEAKSVFSGAIQKEVEAKEELQTLGVSVNNPKIQKMIKERTKAIKRERTLKIKDKISNEVKKLVNGMIELSHMNNQEPSTRLLNHFEGVQKKSNIEIPSIKQEIARLTQEANQYGVSKSALKKYVKAAIKEEFEKKMESAISLTEKRDTSDPQELSFRAERIYIIGNAALELGFNPNQMYQDSYAKFKQKQLGNTSDNDFTDSVKTMTAEENRDNFAKQLINLKLELAQTGKKLPDVLRGVSEDEQDRFRKRMTVNSESAFGMGMH